MISLIRELFRLLEEKQRRKFYGVQVLVVLMAISEVLGVASIAPFMALVGNSDSLNGDGHLAQLYQNTGIDTPEKFIFLTGLFVLVMLVGSAAISTYTLWRLSMFSAEIGTEISDRLYRHYMNQPWIFHAMGSSAQLTKQISYEAIRITDGIIYPLMQMNAKIILSAAISTGIFYYNPKIAIGGLIIFSLSYALFYKLFKKKLHENGNDLSIVAAERFRLINEGFGGVRDILLMGRVRNFTQKFEITGRKFAYARGSNSVLQQVPRIAMELIAFGSMVILVLYLIVSKGGELGLILPALSIYALAGFKLLPALQQIYNSISQIKSNISAYESVRVDLMNSRERADLGVCQKKGGSAKFVVEKSIQVEDVVFAYPGKNIPSLNGFSAELKVNGLVGIVGPSGSGKSTLIDVILGLIRPNSGVVKVDGKILSDENIRSWQNEIGFVSQSIFLSEGSIVENIAFGVSEDQIDYLKIEKIINLVNLRELVSTLELGLNSKVGERGVQLSGGQRQRIGIARALYHDASVLVFDEATSALDGNTEKFIMDAIHELSGQKTIIMIAHRLNTVRNCDQILYIENGRLVDQGTYDELIESSLGFRRMASNS